MEVGGRPRSHSSAVAESTLPVVELLCTLAVKPTQDNTQSRSLSAAPPPPLPFLPSLLILFPSQFRKQYSLALLWGPSLLMEMLSAGMPEALGRPGQHYLQGTLLAPTPDVPPPQASAVAGATLEVLTVLAGCTSAKTPGNFAEQDLLLMSPGGSTAHLKAAQPRGGEERKKEGTWGSVFIRAQRWEV